MTLQEYDPYMKYLPSTIAASCVCIACSTLGMSIWVSDCRIQTVIYACFRIKLCVLLIFLNYVYYSVTLTIFEKWCPVHAACFWFLSLCCFQTICSHCSLFVQKRGKQVQLSYLTLIHLIRLITPIGCSLPELMYRYNYASDVLTFHGFKIFNRLRIDYKQVVKDINFQLESTYIWAYNGQLWDHVIVRFREVPLHRSVTFS